MVTIIIKLRQRGIDAPCINCYNEVIDTRLFLGVRND